MMQHLQTLWHVVSGMKARMDQANLSLVAAGGAFFTMLSLFPGLAAVIALLGLVTDPTVVDEQLGLLADFIPEQAFGILEVQIRRLAATSSSTLGWATVISTGAALWSARRGTDAMIKALNAVYDAPLRGGLRSALAALLITLALIVVAIVAVLSMVVLPVILAFLPLGAWSATALEALRWILALVVVISGVWVLYRFAPNCAGARVGWLSPGAMLAIGVWGAASLGFTYYLENFGSYNEVYGSIGAVIALLMFLYITIFTVLLGATLNAELNPDGQPRDTDMAQTTSPVAAVDAGAAPAATSESLPMAETHGHQS